MFARASTADVVVDPTVRVPMSDGVQLGVSVYRPAGATGPLPVVMSVTPYGKHRTPDRIGSVFMRLSGVRFGRLDRSRLTGFEAPDPVFWTRAGYVVVQADVRGKFSSGGHLGVLTDRDALDYSELIEWAARQPWSSGAVGLCGVSYLAMSQWRVAALRPPALRAIVVWEGTSDLLREFGYQDGVTETGFIDTWWRFRMLRGRSGDAAEDFPADRDAHPFDDAYWDAKRADLAAIDVPALVCGSWSDHGLHTRGSFEGFERIASEHKWLYTHGRRKWEVFYSAHARMTQRCFLDHFLRGADNGWLDTPRVRLETRRTRTDHAVRPGADWPLPSTRYERRYLDAADESMPQRRPTTTMVARFDPTDRHRASRHERMVSFTHHFERATELTGSMCAHLWVSVAAGDDADLFVVVRKFDAHDNEVPFLGYNGLRDDAVAKGWLRASHRELDETRSRRGRPVHRHRSAQPLVVGEPVAVDVEILPSSTLFEKGSSLRLDVRGDDATKYPAFRHARPVTRGAVRIHTGARYDSYLDLPVVPVD